jgi:hypothetical protein
VFHTAAGYQNGVGRVVQVAAAALTFGCAAQLTKNRCVLGVLQPVISMTEGVWYRWRLLYSGAKGWSTFRFLDTNMRNSQQCEWLLIAKDGERTRRRAATQLVRT